MYHVNRFNTDHMTIIVVAYRQHSYLVRLVGPRLTDSMITSLVKNRVVFQCKYFSL